MMFLLATSEVLTNPIIVGLVVGLPATLFGILAYRRATMLDKTAVQAAQIASQGDAVKLVIDGLDRIVANLRTDNAEVRQVAADLTEQLALCRAACAALRRGVSDDEHPAG